MRNRVHAFLFIFISCLVFGVSISNAQSIKIDEEIGKEGANQVIQQIGIYDNEELGNYINTLGQNLVNQLASPLFKYSFHVVDMKEPNAFALPGGYIYISRGLLCVANTEDELAGVIGHEIVHAHNRHSVQQMKKSIFPTLLQLPGAVVGTVVNEDLGAIINAPISAGSDLFLSNYSRRHEKEADMLGADIAAAAGYNPMELAVILANLSNEMETLTGEEEKFSYFNSHPYTPDRVKSINKYGKRLDVNKPRPIAKDKNEFLHQLDGIYFWDNPAQGVFKENEFFQPDLNFYMSFPKSWTTFNTPVAVGAVDKENERGMVYMGLAPENKEPQVLGEEYVAKLNEKHTIEPQRAEKLDLNGIPAYLVSLIDTSGEEAVGIHNMWFKMDTICYQMIGVAYESDFDSLKYTAQSIRKLTTEERNSIEVPVLKIVETQKGESIKELNERTGNMWEVPMTAVMNNITQDVSFEEGELLKITVKETYKPTE